MDKKKCFKCGKVKPLSEFYKHKEMLDGHLNKCKACARKDVQENYKNNRQHYNEYDKKRQRTDIHRILNHRYIGIKQRCTGNATRRYRVFGMEYLSKEEWDDWCEKTKNEFMRLYKIWEASGYDRKYCPSVDRINNKKGYTKGNIQWLSLADNCHKFTKRINS